jgi:HSP90 family molecular chaperone
MLSVHSIAEQLYSSKYRFLYELIQNADDSMYSKANGSGLKPSLTFNITPSCFIIETNEDGFT